MKTKLDQIPIPPLCKKLSEMAHTLVGKVVSLHCVVYSSVSAFAGSWVQSPMGAISRTLGRVKDTVENFF